MDVDPCVDGSRTLNLSIEIVHHKYLSTINNNFNMVAESG